MLGIKNEVEVFPRQIISCRKRQPLSTLLGKVENCELLKCLIFAKQLLNSVRLLTNGLFRNWQLLARGGNESVQGSCWWKLATSPNIPSYILKVALPENLEVFMEIHHCYWCIVCLFFFSQNHVPEQERSPSILTRGEDTGGRFLWTHVQTQPEAGGAPPVSVCPQFQFPVSTQHTKLRHLPPPLLFVFWQENDNISHSPGVLHQQHTWERGSCSHPARAARVLGEQENVSRSLLFFWDISGDPPPYEADTSTQP